MTIPTLEERRQTEAEEVGIGARCKTCNRWMSIPTMSPGKPRDCYHCEDLLKPEATRDNPRIRCPKCRFHWDARFDRKHAIRVRGLDDDDDVEVTCPKCDHEFEVIVCVTCSFESPAIIDAT